MNFVPLFKSKTLNKRTTLHVGVAIRYEENDAEELVHILSFLEKENVKTTKKAPLLPTILLNGDRVSVGGLIKSFNKFPEGRRSVNGVVSLLFLDEMRTLFETYLANLEEGREKTEKIFEWDEDHPFYNKLEIYRMIARLYFPPKVGMH